jgi:hypothetical protein
MQLYLARRFRRLLNPLLALATVLVFALTAAGTALLTAEAEHLRVAKKDAFDSLLALNQARAISYDANADESRYLIDPQRADQYQQAFLAKSQQLLTLTGADLTSYDQALAIALTAYHNNHDTIGWHGFYGTEFRNITFTGERDAAETTLQRYQTYQQDDRRIRHLATTGHLRDAIALCTSYHPGDSNYAFDRYDQALAALIAINQNAFEHAIHDGDNDLRGWSVIPWATAVAIAALAVLGPRARLTEYQ